MGGQQGGDVMIDTPQAVRIGDEVAEALKSRSAVVALESAVLTHGLPDPRNIDALRAMDEAVRRVGAVPAVCVTHAGAVWIGATSAMAEEVSADPAREKVSVRDLGRATALGISGGLTVSATLHVARLAGISVFATGGIGGVHVGAEITGDVSADLLQLARVPVITVCSGAKSVLDIPRTLEFLEMSGVPVYGFKTDRFPAFYLTESGHPAVTVASAADVARIARSSWSLGLDAGLVVGNPIPQESAIDPTQWAEWMQAATEAALRDRIVGRDVTPYLLGYVADASGGVTVDANIALLRSNAAVAGEIAVALLL
jgi:pseudouridine-5'-phosphate glycosidase